ncbi:MAG: hypothetical protein GY799_26790 [Desulfobulbaceae bacterium]|nr:hypothetical protein [Desulfobulbaceae bacterium]
MFRICSFIICCFIFLLSGFNAVFAVDNKELSNILQMPSVPPMTDKRVVSDSAQPIKVSDNDSNVQRTSSTVEKISFDISSNNSKTTAIEKPGVQEGTNSLATSEMPQTEDVEEETKVSELIKIEPIFPKADAVQNVKSKNLGPKDSLGCFLDKQTRDIDSYTFSRQDMTTSLCVDTCSSKGFRYAATQYSSHCFCGDSYGSYGKADNCDMICSGNAKEICGGPWANSVYDLEDASGLIAKKISAKKDSLGCFLDKQTRDIDSYTFSRQDMTTSLCVDTCSSKGFRYAATQYSSHCFCGDSYGSYGKADNCDMTCSGNAKEICGGPWANSVYDLR